MGANRLVAPQAERSVGISWTSSALAALAQSRHPAASSAIRRRKARLLMDSLAKSRAG